MIEDHRAGQISRLLLRFGAPCFFIILLLSGLLIYRDFGLAWDDVNNLHYGNCWYQAFVSPQRPECLQRKHTLIHTPFFELVQVAVARLLNLSDMGVIYRTRHLCTFLLIFLSVLALYQAAGFFELSPGWRLLACLMFVLTPRLFADYFYNSVDSAALAFMLFSFVSMVRFLESPRPATAVVHGVVSGLALAARLTSLLILALTAAGAIAVVYSKRRDHRGDARKTAALTLAVLVICAAVVYAVWPNLWDHPIDVFIEALTQTSTFSIDIYEPYFENILTSRLLPWHYNFVWIAVTLPPVYLLLFLIGAGVVLRRLPVNPLRASKRNLLEGALLLWVAAPVAAAILFHTSLYNGWRHHYFIYPPIVLVAVIGLREIQQQWRPVWIRSAIACLLAADLAYSMLFIVRSHPYQAVYFSPLINGVSGAVGRFGIEFWGYSYTEGLQRLVTSVDLPEIRTYIPEGTLHPSREMLTVEDRGRVKIVPLHKADFALVKNLSYPKPPHEGSWSEIFSIYVEEVPILTAYRRANSGDGDNPQM